MYLKLIKNLKKFLRPIRNITYFTQLKNNNFSVKFCLEGNLSIKLPTIGYGSLTSKASREFSQRCFDYSQRPTAEALLRKTVYSLIQCGYIDPEKSIIDIGSWIADNTIVWAKLLSRGNVYAIDPSEENIQFGMKIATLNELNNIHWVKAVCSDKSNIPLTIQTGDSSHAAFGNSNDSKLTQYVSTTLDEIVPENLHTNISLLHVDVEGFEERVILGAKSIISKSNPVVIFEQHISNEDPSAIMTFLKSKQYDIFMINEVLPGCAYDCRNFIAFSSNKPLPSIPPTIQHQGRAEGIWYATIGDSLIRIY